MKRFVYTPRVEAYIKLRDGRIIDVSNEIISGSISLRLNAMSEAELTLQNKHGRFVRRDASGSLIQSMDRIIIRMSRVGQPDNVFAGYIDEAPHYQLYSGPITIRASCILKLLQYTFFDPGIMAMAGTFAKYGWQFDGSNGLIAQIKSFDTMDSTGSIKDLIRGMLIDVAGWDPEMIQIQDLPEQLIEDLRKIIQAEDREWKSDYERIMNKLKRLFAVDTSASVDVGGAGPGGSASPRSGNIHPTEIALMLMDNGADQDLATKLVAIAQRESSFISDNINYNGGDDGSSGDGSYDFGLFQFNTVHASGATNNGRGLSGPPSGATLAELKEAVKKQPQWVQDFYKEMSDPQLASAKAVRFAQKDPVNLPDWAPRGKTWREGISDDDMKNAANWVKEAIEKRKNGGGTSPVTPPNIPGPDEGTRGDFSYTFQVDHPTTNWSEDDGGPAGNGIWGAKDLSAHEGTKVLAPENGKITYVGSADPGQSIHFTGNSGQKYWLGHVQNAHGEGTYKAGDVIGEVTHHPNGDHLHIGGLGWIWTHSGKGIPYKSTDGDVITVPHVPLEGLASNSGAVPNVGGGASGVAGTTSAKALSPGAVRDIAAQTFFSLQTGGFDLIGAQMLTGERALSNDVSLMEWISQIITGAGRVFTSDANGYFRAFFPDYFGIYGGSKNGQTPVFFISEIEIIDLTIQQSDRNLTTHVFGTGPIVSYDTALTMLDRLFSSVASIEHPAFDWFLSVDELNSFDKINFLKRYGARPYNHDMPYVLKPELLWMGAWMKFLELWSLRFTCNAQFTFMPEIRPGWLINIANRVQMFVNGVTHSFNYTSGFTTTAELTSAASLTDDITWLPRAGRESVIDELPDFGDAPDDTPIESGETSTPDIPEGSPIHPR